MAIESSTSSPLSAAMAPAAAQPADEYTTIEADEQEDEEEERVAKPRGGNLKEWLVSNIDNINIARDLDQSTLDTLGQDVCREYDIDENSRSDWKDKADKAMKFATQETQPKQFPWPSASNVIFPLISQAALQFGARTYPAIIQNKNVVKGCVYGSDKGTPITQDGKPDGQPKLDPQGQPVWLIQPGEKRKRADKIGEHMSWQLLDEMPEWEPQTDQLLHQLPIIGGAVRKTYRDPAAERNYSLFVSLMKLTWNYHSPSFEAAPRHTEELEWYPHQITEFERTGVEDDEPGMFLPLVYGPGGDGEDGEGGGQEGDPDAPHIFLEQHRRVDLDGDGYAEPYVVTVHKRSAKVVRIVARYDEEGIEADEDGEVIRKITPVDHYTLIPFLPSIDGGSYPMGFGHLLKPLNSAINTTLNQMFDAGTLQNSGGGFVSDQLGIHSGPVNFSVGKYVRVTTKGQAIRDSVFPLPFQGPSPVLFQLLGVLLAAGKEVASIQDILTGDAAIANAPPTTVLALIEQGMKVYTAIHKRVYRALKSEFSKLYRLNRLYLTEDQRYQIGDEWREITPEDYRLGGGVEPIADPTMITDMQKLGRAQLLMTVKDDPLVNRKEILTRLFDAANVDRVEDLFAPPQPPNPMLVQAAQLEMAQKQADIGKTRAQEQQAATQAFLNLANARKIASAPEEQWIEAQLDFLRLHIEALNTTVKAAAIDHKYHDSAMRFTTDAADRAAKVEPTPGPAGAFPVPPDGSAGVPSLASQPGNPGIPAIPGGPGG